MKVHLCCGDIYLKGYINCDIEGELVESTTIPERSLETYYSNRLVGHKHKTQIDRKFDITCFPWDFKDESVEEVVMIQAIEHFDFPMAQQIIDEILRILIPGGQLLIDFPDIVETIHRYGEKDPEFMMRFIYCNHKNQYSVHNWGYTRETFPKLLGVGWDYKYRDIVHHIYPVIGCEATKLK